MRDIVSENMVRAEYTATMRSLQLFALPYCKLLDQAKVDRCMERGRSLDQLVACADSSYSRLYGRLLIDKHSISGERRSSGLFDVGARDRSFVTWSGARYRATLADLLAGKEVALPADMGQAHQVKA